MIVVVIVGILATIAVVGYRKLVSSSKSTEAQQVVQSIRLAQQNYYAMTGNYLDVSSKWCPGNNPAASAAKRPWDGDCPSGGGNQWKRLTVKTDGPVMFSYKTWAGNSTGASPTTMAAWGTSNSVTNFNGHPVSWGNASAGPWFTVMGQGDPQNSGSFQARALGHSQSNVVELEETY
jgi:type IV pilus assembly protein PilA